MTEQDRQCAHLVTLGFVENGEPRHGYRYFRKPLGALRYEDVVVGPRGGIHSDGVAGSPGYVSRYRPELRAPKEVATDGH